MMTPRYINPLTNLDAARVRHGRVPSREPAFTSASAAKLIEQQMYFWGADVFAPQGNLLVAWGCRKFRQDGQQHSVHFYSRSDTRTRLLLHSTGAQLHLADNADAEGIAYLRPHHRVFRSAPDAALPLPATHRTPPSGVRSLRPQEVTPPLTALLQLIRDYERWAAPLHAPGRRQELWRDFRKVPLAIRWLPPAESAAWLDGFLRQHGSTLSADS
jgi:hypothetical protein